MPQVLWGPHICAISGQEVAHSAVFQFDVSRTAVVNVSRYFASLRFVKDPARFSHPRPYKDAAVFQHPDLAARKFVAVITTSKKINVEELTEGENVKPEEIGDYELYVKEGDDKAVTLVDDYTMAVGPVATMRKVLKRDDDAELSEEFEAAWEDVDNTQHVYVVATLGNLMKMAGAALPPGFPVTPDQLQKLTSASATAEAAKHGVKIGAEINCSEAALAAQLKALADAIIQQQAAAAPPPVQAVLGTVKTKADEEYLAISLDLDVNLLVSLAPSQAVPSAPKP